MLYEMRRRKANPTLLPTQVIFSLRHPTCMVWKELAFDDAVSYAQRGNGFAAQLNVKAVTGIHTPVPRVPYPAL